MAETNFQLLLRAWLSEFQVLEDAMAQVLTARAVDVAVGAQLDVLGKIVGQPREGLDDDDFRRHVRARILTNRSRGSIAEMLAIADLIVFDDDATYVLDNQGAASYVLRVEGIAVTADVAGILLRFLRLATAAGVRVIVEYSEEDPADWLILDVGNMDEQLMMVAI